MPADSAIAAIMAFYDTLLASSFPNNSRPNIWLDEAPQALGSTSISEPPYVIIEDGGEQPYTDSIVSEPWAIGQAKTTWLGSFTLRAYYTNLGLADAAMKAILWNGEDPQNKAGLAFCTLSLNLPLESYPYTCVPGRNFRRSAGFMPDNQQVFLVQQEFERRLIQHSTLV